MCRKGEWISFCLLFLGTKTAFLYSPVHAGDVVHLLHVVPEPSMIHVWPGMYVPPDDNAEQEEVNHSQHRTMLLTRSVNKAYLLVYTHCFCSNDLHPSCWVLLTGQ